MAEAESVSFGSLAEFLDTLPTKPCPTTPMNRYYCTVCERLNKSIAQRCDYSKIKEEGVVGGLEEGSEGSLKFEPLLDDKTTTTEKSTDQTGEKVEFKIVTPNKVDQDYPLFEFVQPKDKKIEPIEMELLEDVALEFKVSEDEPIEVEALEVAPLDEDEFEDEGEGEVAEVMEVEVLEATEVESEDFDTYPGSAPALQEFKPVSRVPKPKKGVKAKGPVPKRKPGTGPSKVSRKPIKKSKGVSKVPKKKTSPPSQRPRPSSQKVTYSGEPTWTPPSTKTPPRRLEPVEGGVAGTRMGVTTMPTQKRITPVQPRQPQVQMQPEQQPYPTQRPTSIQPPKATKTIVKTPKKVATVRKVPKRKM